MNRTAMDVNVESQQYYSTVEIVGEMVKNQKITQ
jgi:hypothetical protein